MLVVLLTCYCCSVSVSKHPSQGAEHLCSMCSVHIAQNGLWRTIQICMNKIKSLKFMLQVCR